MAAGAVLVQHATWDNARRAIANLRDADALHAESIARQPARQLEQLIRPSGTFRVKTRRLQALAHWWLTRAETACKLSTHELRASLLSVSGIGQESADCILLYAFARPAFIADAYARRWMHRMGWIPADSSYGDVQDYAMAKLPHDVTFLNEAHALIVKHAKQACRAMPVSCAQCVLREPCVYRQAPA